jgi:hypothetical protein
LLPNALFYVVAPLAIGFCFGLSQTPFGGQYSVAYSIAIWVANFMVFWAAAGLASRGLDKLSRQVHLAPAPILTLIAGGLIGKLVSLWPREIIVEWVLALGGYSFSRKIESLNALDGSPSGIELLIIVSNSLVLPIVYWVTARLLFLTICERMGIWGSSNNESASPDALLLGLPNQPLVRGTSDLKRHAALVVALRSEQNYVRVIFEQSEVLVRMTMHEAVNALADVKGMQVHRSYWVGFPHVAELKRDGRKRYLVCTNGLAVPLSDAKFAALKQHVQIDRLETRGRGNRKIFPSGPLRPS